MATLPDPSPCMIAHYEKEKDRFRNINYAALLYSKLSYGEPIMSISIDQSGMGLAALFKGVYQVRAIGSGGVTPPPSVFSHTMPSSMTIGMDYQVSFSGVTSTQGAITYTLSSPAALGSMMGFSKATGILAGENITVTVHASTGGGAHDAAVPGNYSVDVRAYTGQTLVATNTINFTLAAASVAVAVSDVFNAKIYAGHGAGTMVTTNVDVSTNGGSIYIKSTDASYDYYVYGAADHSGVTDPSLAWLMIANDTSGDRNQSAITPSTTGFTITGGLATTPRLAQDGYNFLTTTFKNSPGFYKTYRYLGGGSTAKPYGNGFSMDRPIGMAIVKAMDVNNWYIWHRSRPNSRGILNASGNPLASSDGWMANSIANDGSQYWTTAPTTTGLTVGASLNNPGTTYTVQVFAHDEGPDGVIHCGRFEWDNAAPNTAAASTVVLGWMPQYMLLMREDGSERRVYSKELGWTGPYPLPVTATTLLMNSYGVASAPAHTSIALEENGFRPQDLPSGSWLFMAVRSDPNAVTTPTVNGSITYNIPWPNQVTAGQSFTMAFGGITATSGTVLFSLNLPSGFTASKTTGIGVNETITITAGNTNGSYNVGITVDTSPASSNGPLVTTKAIEVIGAVVAPTMSGTINHNIPSSVTAASNYNVAFSGKTASSGTVVYGINVTSGSQYVTFSKTSGIAAGETVTMSVASNAPNGGGFNGIISANTTPVAASNPDNVGFSGSTLAIIEPDPTLNGFSHTVPANVDAGGSYTVTFSGTSSSNGNQVWYSLSPQSGLSFSKLDNISPGESITLTVSGSASGTLGVTVYANTTKNDGSTFTQSKAYIQSAVTPPVPVTINTDHLGLSLNMVSTVHSFETDGINPVAGATFTMTISGAVASDGRAVYYSIASTPGYIPNKTFADMKIQGTQFTFVGPDVTEDFHPKLVVKDSNGTVYDTKDLSSLFGLPSWGTWEPASLPLNVSN